MYDKQHISGTDPGTAAVQAGHAHVLPWLASCRVPLDLRRTLLGVAVRPGGSDKNVATAVKGGPLPAARRARGLGRRRHHHPRRVRQAAAGSMAVAAAAASGPAAERLLPLLQALWVGGCPADSHGVLAAALRDPAVGQEVDPY